MSRGQMYLRYAMQGGRRRSQQGVGPRTLSRLTGVSYSVVYKATSAANEQYLQSLYKQMQAAIMACEYNPEDEEWLTYVEQDEYAKYPEY